MRTLNSFNLGPNQSDEGQLPEPVSFPKGQIANRIRVEASIPVLNNTGGSVTLTNAQAVDLMTKYFGSWRLAFGKEKEEIVDPEVNFARMRRLCIQATGRDMLFNNKQLKDYANTDADAIVIANTATVTVKCEFIRPFIYERLGSRMNEWCPGYTQMKQLKIKIIRGGALATANLSQSGSATNVVSIDHEDGEDRWAPVFRLKRNQTSGLEQVGPAGGLLAMWEDTAKGSLTALQIITLQREGDTDLHTAVNAGRVQRIQQLKNPIGSFDLNALDCTVIYQLEDFAEKADVPTSTGFKFIQADPYLSPMSTDWLHVPQITDTYRDGIVADNATSETAGAGKEVLGVVRGALMGERPTAHDAAIDAIALVTPDSPKYNLVAGRHFERGQPSRTHIPEGIVKAVGAAVNAQSGAAAADKLASEAHSLSTFIPGATSALRGGVTQTMAALSNLLAPTTASKVGAPSKLGKAA